MIRGVIKGLGGLQKVFQIKRSVGALKLWMAGCQFSSSIQSLNQVTGFSFVLLNSSALAMQSI